MVATGTALLARLKLYAVTAQATEVAEQLVKAHVGPASQMGMQQVSKLINTLSTHLIDLSEELLKSDSPTPLASTAAALARKQGACLLRQLPPCSLLTALGLPYSLVPCPTLSGWLCFVLSDHCLFFGCIRALCNLQAACCGLANMVADSLSSMLVEVQPLCVICVSRNCQLRTVPHGTRHLHMSHLFPVGNSDSNISGKKGNGGKQRTTIQKTVQ